MKSLKCPNCGGPIELEDQEIRTTCPYCGGSLERTIAMPRLRGGAGRDPRLPGDRGVEIRRGARTPRQVIGCTLLVVVGIAALGAFIALRAVRIGREVADGVANARRGAMPPGSRPPASAPLPL
jgi:DNA-directed RNA polymerase subunit RPC12/RpoP